MLDAVRIVSIRRADYWLVEVRGVGGAALPAPTFQSAGRIIGWLKAWRRGDAVSIRRANVKVPYYYNTFLHWNALRRYTSDSQAFAPCFAARSFEKQRDP